MVAYQTMMQAHQNGMACVGRFCFEIAEVYHEGLKVQGIVSDIVPVEDEES
jgi:ATP-dependent Clp protease adapter protein ClpS